MFGYNINFSLSPAEISETAERLLGSGSFGAIEVTDFSCLRDVDESSYNNVVLDVIKRYNPKVSVHTVDFNLAEENEILWRALLDQCRHSVDYLADYMGGRDLVLHGGHLAWGLHSKAVENKYFTQKEYSSRAERCFMLSVETMQKVCDYAGEKGVTVYTENIVDDSFLKDADDLLAYIDAVGRPNLKAVLDLGHAHFCGLDVPDQVRRLGRRLGHLHIYNSFRDVCTHNTLEEGDIDIDGFVKALVEVGYSGTMMFEVRQPADPQKLLRSAEMIEVLYENYR